MKISNHVAVYLLKNTITNNLHSFNEMCISKELKLQEKAE